MRARAVAIWMLGLPLGLGLANGAGGWILQNWGWRNAFYIAAVPGILCAVAALAMREPPRGTLEAARGRRAPPRRAIPYLLVLSIPTMLWIIVSGALHNFNMYALGAFVAPFLVRFHHMSFVNAGWVAACVYGFSGIVGLTVGGCAGRSALREARRRPADRRHRGDRHLHAADVPRPRPAGRRRRRLRAADGHSASA